TQDAALPRNYRPLEALSSKGLWLALPTIALLVMAAQLKKPTLNPEKLANLKTSQLIDQLTEVSGEGVGSHSMVSAAAFLAVEEERRFQGGVLGAPKPKVSPVMRELVRRGIIALPDLLEHVDDARTTKLVVGDKGFFTDRWHSDEYSPRHRD